MFNANASISAGKMLLVSPSSLTMYQVAKSAHRFHMSVQVCTDTRVAAELLNRQKFDAVTVDLSLGPNATAVLEQARLSQANHTAVAFAISATEDQSAAAFKAGSSFVLERPLSLDSIRRTLHAAHGLILRELRRYFRCPLSVPVLVRQEGNAAPQFGETSDISEGGIGLRLLSPLKPGVEGMVQFTLPDMPVPIRAEARVCRCDETGKAGLTFLSLSAHDRKELLIWLADHFEKQLTDGADLTDLPPQALPELIAPAWSELT